MFAPYFGQSLNSFLSGAILLFMIIFLANVYLTLFICGILIEVLYDVGETESDLLYCLFSCIRLWRVVP